MTLRWLLLLVLWPSIAFAHRIRIEDPVAVTAQITRGVHAGTLELAFQNPNRHATHTVIPRSIVVELSNPYASTTVTITNERYELVELLPRGTYVERFSLDERTRDLPPGDYDARIVLDATQVLTAHTFAPYHCGLQFDSMKKPPARSKLPYVLGGLAIALFLVGLALHRRGAVRARVPHSIL